MNAIFRFALNTLSIFQYMSAIAAKTMTRRSHNTCFALIWTFYTHSHVLIMTKVAHCACDRAWTNSTTLHTSAIFLLWIFCINNNSSFNTCGDWLTFTINQRETIVAFWAVTWGCAHLAIHYANRAWCSWHKISLNAFLALCGTSAHEAPRRTRFTGASASI